MKRILLTLVMAFSLALPALASGYTDVADGAWYSDAVLWASRNKVVNGFGGGASRDSVVSWINGLGLDIEAK